MPDPNSVPVNIGATTATIIPAPGPTTTINPPPGSPAVPTLAFIVIVGLDLTCSSAGTVTLQSVGGPYPTRTLDVIQTVAGGGIVKSVPTPSAGGYYQCDPGAAFSITNTAGTVSGSIRYTVKGAP